MLFNSYSFILLFLPLTWVAFVVAARRRGSAGAVGVLVLASLIFYGWWSVGYLLLLAALLLVNYAVGLRQERAWERHGRGSRAWLVGILAANLGVLVYFKYAHFFVATAAAVTGQSWSFGQLVLPLGISFFVFQKIAYQVDSYRGETRGYRFDEFCAFVLFFPQLIAGPIVYHREVIPQFRTLSPASARAGLAGGFTLFSLGLFKKIILADSLSQIVNPVFNTVAAGHTVIFAAAWGGAIAYTLQLYFDFSGYSDMAVGLARMFGIRLPFNFDAPYQATNITEFWRRWHITLSRFLREYLYIPLGGNRVPVGRRYFNLLVTMILGGLWHGAGWTFVLWGALHGTYLVIHRAWSRIAAGWSPRQGRLWPWLARGLTLYAVVVGWVLFRAEDLTSAVRLLAIMHHFPGGVTDQYPAVAKVSRTYAMACILAAGLIALFGPSTRRLFEDQAVQDTGTAARPLVWRASLGWALVTGLIFFTAFFSLTQPTEFLYFQF